jgi:hypothetical protein
MGVDSWTAMGDQPEVWPNGSAGTFEQRELHVMPAIGRRVLVDDLVLVAAAVVTDASDQRVVMGTLVISRRRDRWRNVLCTHNAVWMLGVRFHAIHRAAPSLSVAAIRMSRSPDWL